MENNSDNMLLRAGLIMLIPLYTFIMRLMWNDTSKYCIIMVVQILFVALILALSGRDNELRKIFDCYKNIRICLLCKCIVFGVISYLIGFGMVSAAGSVATKSFYAYDVCMPRINVFVCILEMVVLMPVIDELLYRHIFCRDVKRLTNDEGLAVISAAVLFSLFSLDKGLFVLLLPLGVLTGMLQVRYENTLYNIMAHVGFDLALIVHCFN